MINLVIIFIKIVFVGILFPLIISLFAYVYLIIKFYFFRKRKNLKNKHILILGASSGLGEALCYKIISQEGVKLSIASRREQELKKVQNKCLEINSKSSCDYYIVDITNDKSIKLFLEKSISKFGFPSMIINCAGIAHPGFINELNFDTYISDMNLNYFGNLKLLKETINQYKINENNIKDDKIDIICVGSCLGIIGSIGYTAYCPTKFALKGLLDSLKFELINTKIKLHYYGPSNMLTPGLVQENKTKPKIVSDMENNVKNITAEEAADVLLCNLDKYMITSEPDLELLKLSSYYMNENHLIDLLLMPVAILGVIFSRKSIENNIKKNYMFNNHCDSDSDNNINYNDKKKNE
jgi:short-subunit dehydrogenase